MQKLSRGLLLNRAIQEQVKEYITRNGLGPDDLLPPEGQLAQDLGVSRGSVREAIKALESLGIVDVRHGDGVRVRSFNLDSILDLLSYGAHFDPNRVVEVMQLRIWLEDAAVVDAVRVIDDATLAEMDLLLERWEAKAQVHADTSEEDRGFHALLYAGLKNQSLSQLIDIFWRVYHALPREDMGADQDPVATVRSHSELLAAVKQRDAQAVRRKMRAHFSNLEQRVKRVAQLVQEQSLAEAER